jgi:uncharacterized membrane protein HdeD (DUF308 family)
MIRLFLLLLGAEVVRRRWQTLAVIGAAWCALGLFIFIDSLDTVTLIPVHDFGWFLLIEGTVTLIAASGATGAALALRLFKGISVLIIGLLMIDSPFRSDVALALILGTAFAVDGALKVVSARVVRFPGWRMTQAAGALMLILAIGTLQPLPTWYVGTIGCNVGLLLMLSGLKILHLANRLRLLSPDAPLSSILSPGRLAWSAADLRAHGPADPAEMVVHVWTPTGSLAMAQRRPVIDRYIAAVDSHGAVSTGHAALELMPDVYISHYPAADMDHSPDDFTRMLRATPDNNVRGRFLPNYAEEAAEWCESTMQVRFATFDAARLRAFWAAYRRDDTYNLTRRNCSSAVAHALDAALEGVLAQRVPRRMTGLMRAIVSPELWVASLLRTRAETMAWTPGLVLDYARALSGVIDPPPVPWVVLAQTAWRRRGRADDGSAKDTETT